MKKALLVLIFLVAYPCILAILFYLVETFFRHTPYYYGMADLAVVFANVFVFSVFMFYRARTRDASIKAEAERWLQLRLGERSNPALPRRKQLVKRLLWLPTAIVLASALFLPEIAGILSHVWHGRTLTLQRFHVRTPLTWILETDERNYCWAFIGKGIGRIGVTPYLRQEPPFSEILFYAASDMEFVHDDVYLKKVQILSQRSMQVGDRVLNCWDTVPPHPFDKAVKLDYSLADIGCESKPYDFGAHFSGSRTDSEWFYDTLRNVTVTKPPNR